MDNCISSNLVPVYIGTGKFQWVNGLVAVDKNSLYNVFLLMYTVPSTHSHKKSDLVCPLTKQLECMSIVGVHEQKLQK